MHKTSSRLLALLSLLQARRDWPGEDLAERLGITTRTVRRDIDRLRELGYPVTTVKGPAGGYRLQAGTHLPPLLFDDDQAVALAVALQTAATGTTLVEDAARALAVLRQVMPSRLRHRMDLLHITTVQPPTARNTPQAGAGVVMDLSRAIHGREELRFDYAPSGYVPGGYVPGVSTSAGGLRRVQPHHLITWHQRWYLVAWDLHREDWRTFRVDRIRPRTPTGPCFTPRELPGGDVCAFIASRFRGEDGITTDWPCQGEVVLRLPAADVAPFAQDGIVEELGSHHCRLTLGSWSWTALAASIGRFDTDIEVVGPPRLATAFRDLAARYAHAAGTTSPETGPAR